MKELSKTKPFKDYESLSDYLIDKYGDCFIDLYTALHRNELLVSIKINNLSLFTDIIKDLDLKDEKSYFIKFGLNISDLDTINQYQVAGNIHSLIYDYMQQYVSNIKRNEQQ